MYVTEICELLRSNKNRNDIIHIFTTKYNIGEQQVIKYMKKASSIIASEIKSMSDLYMEEKKNEALLYAKKLPSTEMLLFDLYQKATHQSYIGCELRKKKDEYVNVPRLANGIEVIKIYEMIIMYNQSNEKIMNIENSQDALLLRTLTDEEVKKIYNISKYGTENITETDI